MTATGLRNKLVKKIQNIGEFSFEEVALSVFRYQAQSNPLYAKFLDLLSIDFQQIAAIEQIPFLPIALFKQYSIKTGQWPSEAVFTSSGTTGQTTSRHEIRSLDWYRQLSIQGFEQQYGPLTQYCILALLPSYLERSGSSLVYMAEQFIRQSPYPSSGFFLYDTQKLLQVLQECQTQQIPTLLIGVSFALLDLAQQHPINLEGITIMETGGMKGRRQEITRQELHDQLKMAFRVSTIHSEYGMTELLSQAYSPGEGRFYGMPSMQVHCREVTDPLHLQEQGKSGLLNIIDLANLDTCSFIATDDLGIVHKDGSFEVLGRLDHSDIRGCNLLLNESR